MINDKNNEEKKIIIHKHGFVRLVDYMGDDNRIVQAARVSYGSGTKTFREDRGLIRYLLRNAHSSPFEQVVFTFHIKMPIFVARQWIRHRTARLNEISARYSVMNEEFYVPETKDINYQDIDNKQGRSDKQFSLDASATIQDSIEKVHKDSYSLYHQLIEKGLAREIARIVLPTSLYTEIYWQIDLHNLFHFLKLRLDSHAQKEIRIYAEALYTLTKDLCPYAFEAFEDYILNKLEFSGKEKKILLTLLADSDLEKITKIKDELNLDLSKRELEEFCAKILTKK